MQAKKYDIIYDYGEKTGIPGTHYPDLELSNKFRKMRLQIAKIYKAGQERGWQVEV